MTKILIDTTHDSAADCIKAALHLEGENLELTVIGAVEIFDGGSKITCNVKDDDLAKLRVVNKADLIASVLNQLLLHTTDETEIPLVPDYAIAIYL